MAARSQDPSRDVALIALNSSPTYASDMLEEVLRYAFDQLCWRRTANELDAILDSLRALIAEDA